jgi:hypothetical protein
LNNAPAGGGLRRQRDLGQIVDTALKLYRQNFGEFLAIAGLTLPLFVASTLTSALIGNVFVYVGVSLALVIPGVLLGIPAQAAIARAVADVSEGMVPEFGSIYGRVIERIGTLLRTGFRVVLIFLALCATVVGIPFAFYLAIRWAFFTQAIIIDGESSPRSTEASARIVQDTWWRTFGILIIIGLLANVPVEVIRLAFSPANVIAAGLASAVIAVVAFPFSAVASTLLYFDLSSRKAALAGVGDAGLPGEQTQAPTERDSSER